MPKDPKKNVDRYKIAGGDLNEFEFHQNQAALAEQAEQQGNLIPGPPPEAKARRAQGVAREAQQRGMKKAANATSKKAAKGTSVKGATAKKLAAKKAAKK